MTMTRADWYQRYYKPLPPNVILVSVDHRNDHIQETLVRVMDLHAFGQMLYHDVLAHQQGGTPFDGYPSWFKRAIEKGWIPKPNKPFPVAQINQALLLYSAHTMRDFGNWSSHTKAVTLTSYLAYLRRRGATISLKPITDPYTLEAMQSRRA